MSDLYAKCCLDKEISAATASGWFIFSVILFK